MANEKRLIDANAFLKALNERPFDFLDVGGDFGYFDETIDSVVNEQPAVDAVEVVHGRWLKTEVEAGDPYDGNSVYCFDVMVCSVCGCHFDVSEAMNYCPNCGAKMDGDGNA